MHYDPQTSVKAGRAKQVGERSGWTEGLGFLAELAGTVGVWANGPRCVGQNGIHEKPPTTRELTPTEMKHVQVISRMRIQLTVNVFCTLALCYQTSFPDLRHGVKEEDEICNRLAALLVPFKKKTKHLPLSFFPALMSFETYIKYG